MVWGGSGRGLVGKEKKDWCLRDVMRFGAKEVVSRRWMGRGDLVLALSCAYVLTRRHFFGGVLLGT